MSPPLKLIIVDCSRTDIHKMFNLFHGGMDQFERGGESVKSSCATIPWWWKIGLLRSSTLLSSSVLSWAESSASVVRVSPFLHLQLEETFRSISLVSTPSEMSWRSMIVQCTNKRKVISICITGYLIRGGMMMERTG